MKKLFKILGWILGFVLLFIIAGIAFLNCIPPMNSY